jgi:hypothetical protein
MPAVRLPPDLVEKIDKLRGGVPRERWVREQLAVLIAALEKP